MSLERFYLDGTLSPLGAMVSLDGPEALHMLRVMRKSEGDEVTLFDGHGHEVRALIETCDRRSAKLKITKLVEAPVDEQCVLELAVGLPRGGEAVDLVRRVIEAGADIVRPLVSQRCVHRPDKKKEEKRRERFRQAAVTALKQCNRNNMPGFPSPTKLRKLVLGEGQIGVFGSTREGLSMRAFEKTMGGVPKKMMVVVGPEGGFTDDEEEFLRAAGFYGLTMGNHVLRVETAAVAMLSFFSSAAPGELA